VPGSGTPSQQVHDFNGGILASGLFWTVPASERNLALSRHADRAVLEMRDVAVIDSFQFFGPSQTTASVSFRIEWRAGGPFVARGKGATVPPTDPGAFLGSIAPARSTISATGEEWGFSFGAERAATDRGWAQLGRVRNGVFL
jgi:hypothetical protein